MQNANKVLKRALLIAVILTALFITALCNLVLAQGRWSDHQILETYDPNSMAPPLALIDAYNLAAEKANPTRAAGGSNNGIVLRCRS
jgi:hypothetical protein